MTERLSPDMVNLLYPIIGVKLYPKAMVVRRQNLNQQIVGRTPKRGQVKMLSKRSLVRFLFLVGLRGDVFKSLLTLTYGLNYPLGGREAKRGLRNVLQALRRRFPGVHYFWFCEFQRRGAPHWHVGLSVVPTWEDRQWLALRWSEIAEPGGDFEYCADWFLNPPDYLPKEERVRTNVQRQHRRREVWEKVRSEDGAIRYVARYISKPHQKVVPAGYRDVGRFWGLSRFGDIPDPIVLSGNEAQVRELIAELGRNVQGFDVLPSIIFHNGKLPLGDLSL